MKILIIKISSMGDIVHTMPVVADILHACPNAKIDWLCEENFIDLVQQVKGIRHAIPVALRRWRRTLLSSQTWQQMRAFYRRLRAEHYDWIIDAQGLLKTAILSRMAHGTVSGLANRTEGAGYEWPVRFFYHQRHYIEPRTHVVTRSRLLVAKTLNITLLKNLTFGLTPARHIDFSTYQPYIVFVHGSSRANKSWPLISWQALGHDLIAAGYRIVLPWGGIMEKKISTDLAQALGDQAWVPDYLSLAKITDLLAQARAVIGVDTGLSHIAVALQKPTIQIYRFNTAWRTGGLESDQVICLGSINQTVTANEIKAELSKLNVLQLN